MKMTNLEYAEYVKNSRPKSKTVKNVILAYISGGAICAFGHFLKVMFEDAGLDDKASGTAASVSLIFIAALLTALHVYDNIAKYTGAGTLVPITGFSNAMVSPAMEYKTEGIITGLAVKMFTIAGPVIVFGICASVIYGLVLLIFKL